MLLLGGFAIAAALSKHALAKRGATWILARVGGRPAIVLLTNMLVGAPVMANRLLLVASGVGCALGQVERWDVVQERLRSPDSRFSFGRKTAFGLHQCISALTSFHFRLDIPSSWYLYSIHLLLQDNQSAARLT